MPSFQWKISGLQLKALKHSQALSRITSPVFKVYDSEFTFLAQIADVDSIRVTVVFTNDDNAKYVKGTALFMITVPELDVIQSESGDFTDPLYFFEVTKLKNIQKLKSMTLKLDVELTQVIDKNDMDITALYFDGYDELRVSTNNARSASSKNIQNSVIDVIYAKIEKMEKRMDAIEVQLCEEGKENEIDIDSNSINGIMKHIQAMRKDINNLSCGKKQSGDSEHGSIFCCFN